jgi:hypothetical protein
MAARDLKQWHWIIIGCAVGALLVYLQLGPHQAARFDGATTMDPKTFANSIGQNTQSEKLPMLRNLVVYPAHPTKDEGDGKTTARQIVTGETASESHHDGHAVYVPFVMYAPIPFDYNSKVGLPGADYSVRDLLDHRLEIGQRMTPYRFAWWATAPMTIALWGGGSVVLIGGIWPIVIALLTGGLWAKEKASVPYDLDRFKGEADHPQASAIGSVLAADNDELQEASPQPIEAAAPASVKELDAETLAPLHEQADGPHHYQGEFYPVERTKSPPKT